MSNNQQPPDLKMEVKGDGFQFELRDGVFMLVNWQSRTQLRMLLWQGTNFYGPDVGNLFSPAFRAKLAAAARQRFGKTDDGLETAPNVTADIERVAVALGAPQATGKTLLEQLEEGDVSITDRLILAARQHARFFHDSEQEGFATVKAGTHVETHRIRSRAFRLWLRHRVWEDEKQREEEKRLAAEGGLADEVSPAAELPALVREQALSDAISQLEALARFEGPEREASVRLASPDAGETIFLDLGDEDWRGVRIDRDGWEVVASQDLPVRFVRPKAMRPLPAPVSGGSVEQLRTLLNLPDDDDGERNWRLILAFLAFSLTTAGPYPVLTLLGPQGAAKSTTQRYLRALLDPSKAALRREPNNEHDLYIAALNSWMLSFNNLSFIQKWLSDAICAIASDGGLSTRELYTDREEIIFEARRPVMLNGIGDIVTRPDLLDRALIVNLPAITDRTRADERDLDAAFEAARPEILGALLDAVAVGLRGREAVRLERKSRMADFERFAVATEKALDGESGSFMAAYTSSKDEATQTALESWPVTGALLALAASHQGEESAWQGTMNELLEAINGREPNEDTRKQRDWPKNAASLGKAIDRLIPSLREVGVRVERNSSHKSGRRLKVYSKPPSEAKKKARE
jgi:hypothetical protein